MRRYRLKPKDTPDSLAKLGNGHKRELAEVNKAWAPGWVYNVFEPWNPGMQINIPMAWQPLPDEFPA